MIAFANHLKFQMDEVEVPLIVSEDDENTESGIQDIIESQEYMFYTQRSDGVCVIKKQRIKEFTGICIVLSTIILYYIGAIVFSTQYNFKNEQSKGIIISLICLFPLMFCATCFILVLFFELCKCVIKLFKDWSNTYSQATLVIYE